MVIQPFTFLTHSVSLDNLEVSSGLVEIYSCVISITIETNPVFSNNIKNSLGQILVVLHTLLVIIEITPRLNK